MKFLLLPCILFLFGIANAMEQGNSAISEPRVLVLPLPRGQEMEFAMIPVGNSTNIFTSVDFYVGNVIMNSEDDDESDTDTPTFRNRLTTTSVSGTVLVTTALFGQNTNYWALPMGVTEVTRAQYAAVMGEPEPPKDKAQLPIVGLNGVQIQAFCDKFNEWLATNKDAREVMQRLTASRKHGMPYVRLPLENEWEFAARGAQCVDKEKFDRSIPYENVTEMSENENLYSPSSSLKEVGVSGEPNACGLCDMLGNVREIVSGDFRPEYSFGRVGGLLVRGGSYVDRPGEVYSYTRSEFAPYEEETGKPFTNPVTGFRLVLGSTISTNGLSTKEIETDFVEYWKERVEHRPREVVTDSLTTKLEAERNDLRKQLAALKSDFDKVTQKSSDAANKEAVLRKMSEKVTDMTARLQQMENQVSKSQTVQAQAALLMIYYASAGAAQNSVELRQAEKRVVALKAIGAKADEIETAKLKISVLQDNIATYWEQYARGCEALKEVDETVVTHQESEREKEIRRKALADKNKAVQVDVFRLAMQHYRRYRQNGRLSDEARNAWYRELSEL